MSYLPYSYSAGNKPTASRGLGPSIRFPKRKRQPAPLLTAAPDGAPGVMVPVKTVNPLNNRRHWQVVSRDSKHARQLTAIACKGKLPRTLPQTFRLTRYSHGELDSDNLAAALKPVRDGVADLFGGDDSRKSGLRFFYEQKIAKGHGVLVTSLGGVA